MFPMILLALFFGSLAYSTPNAPAVPVTAARSHPGSGDRQGPVDAPAPALPPSTGGNPPAAKEPDASELLDLGKDMEDFHMQAEKMLQQLERATGTAQSGGPAPNQLDRARQKAMKLASDDRFLKSASDLWGHPDRNKMLLVQLGFFLFMLIVKAWRQSKTHHWFKRLIVGFFFSLLTWIGLLYVIPFLVLGEPFAVFTGTLFKVFVVG